jgi:hypothetical protein
MHDGATGGAGRRPAGRACRWRAAVVALVAIGSVACEKRPSPSAPAASAIAQPAPPTLQAAPVRASQAPPDLDADALMKQLGCGAGKAKHACPILSEFARGARWTGETPSGEGRWFGNAYTLEKGSEKRAPVILLAKRAPTSQVGPSDLPIRVAVGSLPESTWRDAAKLITALSSSSNVSWHNPSVKYVREFSSTTDRGAVATAGASARLISDDAVYLRQGAGRKVLMVRIPTGTAASGDGTYAELWATTW